MNNNEKMRIRAFSELTPAFHSHIISNYSDRQELGVVGGREEKRRKKRRKRGRNKE